MIHNGLEITLKEWMAQPGLDMSSKIRMAVTLAAMLDNIHKQNEIVGGLNPSAILVRSNASSARLREMIKLEGAYRAPEEAGHLNQDTDCRSDLYSLGIILYELFVGTLPFHAIEEKDWEWVHLTSIPQSLSQQRPELGGPLEEIVMKLLEKSPQARYQSTYGLLSDLHVCADMLLEYVALAPFQIGYRDRVSQYHYPDSLFGRNTEMAELEDALRTAQAAAFSFVQVKGPPGIGKSELLQRFKREHLGRGVVFIEGVCTSHAAGGNYEPIVAALRQWADQLWSEEVSVIEKVKMELGGAFKRDRELLAACLPEIIPLLTSSDLDITLPYKGRALQLDDLLPIMIRFFAACGPPIVMLLDNMQWADKGTLRVIAKLASGQASEGLMVISAFREEADLPEELTSLPRMDLITLTELSFNDVRQLVAAIVYEDSNRTLQLARALYLHTKGNPLMLRQTLDSWYLDGKLYYDRKQHRWQWELDMISQQDDLPERARMFDESYGRLSEESKLLLQMASAMTGSISPQLLAEASEIPYVLTLQALSAAEREGIIVYEDWDIASPRAENLYMFIDAYAKRRIYETHKDLMSDRHLKLGRALQRRHPDWMNEGLYYVLDHLNNSVSCMTVEDQLRLSNDNLRAGKELLQARRFTSAIHYFKRGMELLESIGHADRSYADHFLIYIAICEQMVGNKERSKQLLQSVALRKKELPEADRLLLTMYQIASTTFDASEEAIQYGREALTAYGWMLPDKASIPKLLKEIVQTQLELRSKKDKLHKLPVIEDTHYKSIAEILCGLSLPMLMSKPEALLLSYARYIRYGLRKGLNEPLLCVIGMYEILLQRGIPQLYNLLPSHSLEEMYGSHLTSSIQHYRLSFFMGTTLQLHNPSQSSRYLEKAINRAVECNDIASINLFIITFLVMFNGDIHALSQFIVKLETKHSHLMDSRTSQLVADARAYCEAIQCKRKAERYVACDDREEEYYASVDNYGCIGRLETAFLLGKYKEALFWAKLGRGNELEQDWIRNRKLRFFEALSAAALQTEEDSKTAKLLLHKLMKKMKRWPGFLGADTGAHHLITAEWHRLCGSPDKSYKAYERSINCARAEQYSLLEGIACERLSGLIREQGSKTGEAIYMIEAHTAFSIWGVTLKSEDIKARYPNYGWPTSKETERSDITASLDTIVSRPIQRWKIWNDQKETAEEVLMDQLVSWSGSLNREQFGDPALNTALRTFGADRALLLSFREGGFHVKAQIGKQLEEEGSVFAETVLRYAVRTGQSVVLGDATSSYHMKDAYIRRYMPRSILCKPVFVPNTAERVFIYLENSLLPHVFTDRSAALLELIVTRMMYLLLVEGKAPNEVLQDYEAEDTAAAYESPIEPLIEPLTNRETEVLQAISKGLTNKEIADLIGISEATVKTHVFNLYGKLGVKRRGMAVIRAKELNLIE